MNSVPCFPTTLYPSLPIHPHRKQCPLGLPSLPPRRPSPLTRRVLARLPALFYSSPGSWRDTQRSHDPDAQDVPQLCLLPADLHYFQRPANSHPGDLLPSAPPLPLFHEWRNAPFL